MMRLVQSAVVSGILLASTGGHGLAQDGGDPEKGYELARDVCSACHGVEKGYQPSPEPYAPTFEAVANSPGMSPIALSVFLRTPHATMPNLILSSSEISDVIAYIMGLKE